MAADAGQFISTVTASALGAFSAAAVGYRYAVAKFRRERIFEKQLTWSEKATTTFIEAANKLNWAMASALASTPEPEQRRAWAEAHSALIGLRGLEAEAEMYASPSTYEAISEAVGDISNLARNIWTLSEHAAEEAETKISSRLYEIAYKMLYHAASRTATDVREHLELPELSREWRLYDRELRELRAELDALQEKGLDFNDGAWRSARPKPKN